MAKGDARTSYSPEVPSNIETVQELTAYVQRELMEIANAFSNAPARQLDLRNVAPQKPRDGMIVMADGTNWNPGEGRGTYQYDQGTSSWRKLIFSSDVPAPPAPPAVSEVLTGTVIFVPANVAPSGYLKLDGSLVSRTTYAALWTYAQASGNIVTEAAWTAGAYGSFSTGDLSTNFRLPDLRGYFIRGWDNGRGVDAGRAIGSSQADQNLSHGHGVNDGGHSHGASGSGSLPNNSFDVGGSSTNITRNADVPTAPIPVSVSVSISSSGTGISIQSSGGTEVRVKNLALLVCIKT